MATTYEKPTTKPSGPTLPMVASRLSQLRRQIATWFMLEGVAVLLWTALALAAASFLLDYSFRLDYSQRVFLLVVMGLALAAVFVHRLVKPLSTPLTDDALILQVEQRHPELAESLISAVQFKRLGDQLNPHTSRALVEATIAHGTAAAESVRFANIINSAGFTRNVLWLLGAIAIIAGLVAGGTAVPHIRIWFERNLLLRTVSWPQNTYLRVLRAENGRIRIPRGDDYTLQVEATEESRIVPDRVFIDFRDGRAAQAMKASGERGFEAVLANVIQPFDFRVRGGDERTEYVTVELVEPPALEELTLAITYPKYAGGHTEPLPVGRGPYFILPGSSLTLTGKANKPLAQAALSREGERIELSIAEEVRVSGTLTPEQLKTGQFAIELTDTEEIQARRPTTFGLRLRPDREPRVRARLQGIGGMVTARARLPISGRVTDDFGVSKVSVPFAWRGDDEQRKEGAGELDLPNAKLDAKTLDIPFEDVLDLEPLQIPTGTGFTFHVAAADNDDYTDEAGTPASPNIGKSPDFTIRVVTDEELRTDLLRREKEQRQEFERLTKQQEDLLTFSRELAAQLDQSDELTKEQREKLAQTPKQQKLVGTNVAGVTQRLASIVTEIVNNRLEEGIDEDKRPLETRLTQKIVEPLIHMQDEAFPQAVQRVEQSRRASGDARKTAMQELVSHQERLVESMKQILSEMSQAEGYQEAINLIYEVEKMQREVFERTKKAREEREKGILEGADSSKSPEPTPESGSDEDKTKQ